MANKVETAALLIGDAIAKEQGVYLIHAEYKKEGKDRFLRLFIDSESGVGLDECEAFSRQFSDEFDKNDPTEEAYILEVSSPGVDRKLTTQREFEYYTGRLVEVKLYKDSPYGKEFTGELAGFGDKTARIILDSGETVSVKQSDAAYIRLYFEF